MADDLLTLADLAIVNNKNDADYDISDLLDKAPVIRALAADTASNGTVHSYIKETGAPVVGFRAVNVGRDLDSSVDTQVSINLQILDATHGVDQALADAYRRGAAAYVGRESERHLRAAYFKAEQQMFYGIVETGGDAAGFTGINDTLDNYGLTQVIAANAVATVSNRTSVYFIRTGENDAQVIAGNDGLIQVGETVTQKFISSGTLSFPAYYTPIHTWLGFQMGSVWSVVRLCNIPDAGGNLLDDDLIYDALEIFPVGSMPNYVVMNRRSREQLRKSRTATNQTGTPAPTPVEVAGIPIITTDAITNAEADVPAS